MESPVLKRIREQLVTAFVVLYSGYVVATVLPEFGKVSNALVIPYFLFVPGYFVALLLHEERTAIEGIFYSILWSAVIFASLSSLNALFQGRLLPLTVMVPALTLLLLVYDHYFVR